MTSVQCARAMFVLLVVLAVAACDDRPYQPPPTNVGGVTLSVDTSPVDARELAAVLNASLWKFKLDLPAGKRYVARLDATVGGKRVAGPATIGFESDFRELAVGLVPLDEKSLREADRIRLFLRVGGVHTRDEHDNPFRHRAQAVTHWTPEVRANGWLLLRAEHDPTRTTQPTSQPAAPPAELILTVQPEAAK